MADKPAEKPKPSPAAPAGEPVKGMEVSDLQVQVVFEIDSRMMKVKELQALKPGMVLQTGKGLDAPVTLVVNGRRFGTGELVELGGKVGVRVLTLSVQ
jgi:type III secretion protein Q